MMNFSCLGTANRWGGFGGLTFFNASPAPRVSNPTAQEQQDAIDEAAATVSDLALRINQSTNNSPLYIVEAGEPDVIYQALDEAQFFKSRNVRIITHSAANDNSGDFFNLSDIEDDFPDVTVLRIPDQNTRLISEFDSEGVSEYDWARTSSEDKIRFLFNRLERAELEGQRGIVPFQEDRHDPSDAGMVAYWVTGADGSGSDGGRRTPSILILRSIINR